MGEPEEIERLLPEASWVNVRDPASPGLDRVASEEGYYPLNVEDCRHRNQIAKVMPHEAYTFVVIKTIRFDEATLDLEFDDFDLFISAKSLTTVQESPECSVAGRVATRLRDEKAPVGPWRVGHAILDAAVDEYLPVLDRLGEVIDSVESDVLEDPSPQVLQRILVLKRVLIEFRRNAVAMREVLNSLIRTTQPGDDRYLYLRDVYDHLVRALDFIETYRDLVSGSLDIYLSAIANRTNEIVKVLPIWGTVALPLIVITGFYGMTLDLPLQHTVHGVALVIGLMSASTVGIVLFFRRKGWL